MGGGTPKGGVASLVTVMLVGAACATTPPKPDIYGLLKKLRQIDNLSDFAQVASTIGITVQPVTRYRLDQKGIQSPDFIEFVTRQPVPNQPGVTLDQYQVAYAGGTIVQGPAFDSHTTETRLSFTADPITACAKLSDLNKNFGDRPDITPVQGGWGTTYEWRLRKGNRFADTLLATFGTTSNQCATSVVVRQIRSG